MLHQMRAWGRLLLAAVLASLCAGGAIAQDDEYDSLPEWYVGPLAGLVLPDSIRNADQGPNFQFILGATLAESLAVELNVFGSQMASSTPAAEDQSALGGGLDLTLGTPAPGNPFFIVGGGAVSQEIAALKKTGTYGNLGLGAYLPFSLAGELWRLEGRYSVMFGDHPALPAEELLEDGRINLGVLFAFGSRDTVAAREAPEPAPDADGDGVPDATDQCADTPSWARADENGCTPDADGDGVDDAHDTCPETAAGTAVDATGCEPTPAAAEPLTYQGVLDEDADGVADTADACPHTTPRLDIDEKGCVKPETVTLRNVHFDIESSRLTGDGYVLLRQIAASMRASPEMRLEISGHADATGSRGYNEKLSIQRAEVVHDFISYLGIPGSRMQLKAYGETKPLADNKSGEGRAYNRRVEFRRLD